MSAVGYSKWWGGPSISTACGDFAKGLEGWGGRLERGVGVAEGERGGVGWTIPSVDHHLGPGGLWWSTGSFENH